MTSRSNWANDSSTLSVSRPIDVVVLNAWVTLTNETPCRSKISTILAKSPSERRQPVDLVDDDDIDLARARRRRSSRWSAGRSMVPPEKPPSS